MAQSKAKTNSVVTTRWDGDILHINVIGAGALTFDRTKVAADNCVYAEKHGWTQRICDKAALKAPVRQAGMGDQAWADAKHAYTLARRDAMRTVIDYYESGAVAWKMSGAGGEREGGLLLEALVRLWTGKTREAISAFLKTKDAGYKAGLAAADNVAPIIAAIKAERVKVVVDTDDALAEFEAMDQDDGDEDLDAEIAAEMAKGG